MSVNITFTVVGM